MKKSCLKSFQMVPLFFLCLLMPLHAGDLKGKPPDAEQFPSLVKSVRFEEPVLFCGEKVPLEDQQVRERLEKEMLLALWDRAQVVLWIKRSTKYFPHIERVLKQEKLPLDLKYVAVIESGLRPHAGSVKGAVGFWQFLRSTGREYGLRVDSKIDERRNLFTATRAACGYFQKLYEKFQSWPLSMAGYNMGEHGLANEIELQKERDYYQLYLPLETQRYVLKAVAAKLIMENPEQYGFAFLDGDYYPEVQFDRVKMDSPSEVPLVVIAASAKTSFKRIKDLNPQIRGAHLARGKNTVLIPKGGAKRFEKRFTRLFKNWRLTNVKRFHLVKKGENLSTIAREYNVSLASLLVWNNLSLKSRIYPGQRVMITSQ